MSDPPLAAVDVGTSSVHLVIARRVPGGPPEVITRERFRVRLGSGGADMKQLDPEAIDRAVEALDHCRRLAEAHEAEIVAIATSAVREAAADREVFLRRARDEAGIEVEVVSGVEEARLIHLGALSAVAVHDRRHLVIDIGGGSTELVVGEGTSELFARSLKLGHIRLTDRFFPAGVITEGTVKQCRRHLRAFVAPLVREIHELGFSVAVGCSGTIETIATMAAARDGEEPRSVDNAVLTRAALDHVVGVLTSRRHPDDRRGIPGLETHRRDVIVAGAVLLRQLFRSLGIEELIISPAALREGLLLDRFRRRDVTPDEGLRHLADLRRSSVLAVASRYDEDLAHAQHATDLALELFDETAGLHAFGEPERQILEAAGLLHNIGRFVAHAAHHKHSYYVIRNTEHLAGFTDRETELIAQVARYHRKSSPREQHPDFGALLPDEQRRVALLAGLLRLGIALDRTYRRVVTALTAAADTDRLRVRLLVAEGAEIELELFTARDRAGLLADALGLRVEFEVQDPPVP